MSRRYLGVEGKPARYLIITIPPRQSQTSPVSSGAGSATARAACHGGGVTAALSSVTAFCSGDCRLATERSNSDAGAVEPLELAALLPLVEEGMDQCVAGDRLQHPVTEAVVARRPEIFVGEI